MLTVMHLWYRRDVGARGVLWTLLTMSLAAALVTGIYFLVAGADSAQVQATLDARADAVRRGMQVWTVWRARGARGIDAGIPTAVI